MPYGEEGSCSQNKEGLDWPRNPQVSYLDGQFNMDLNTLMFIVGQNRMPMAPKRAPNLPLGPCVIVQKITLSKIVHILGNQGKLMLPLPSLHWLDIV